MQEKEHYPIMNKQTRCCFPSLKIIFKAYIFSLIKSLRLLPFTEHLAWRNMLSLRSFISLLSLTLTLLLSCLLQADENLFLRTNLQQAKPGDFIVISCNKTATLMAIRDKKDNLLTIEEAAVPLVKWKCLNLSWRDWLEQSAPNNTSWVMYEVDLRTGQMVRYFSFSRNEWLDIPEADNFLGKLLNLKLVKIPEKTRKYVGPKPISGPDWRPLWQPQMIVDGQMIKGVKFDAWKTRWPRDDSDLSGKTIEIYLPQESQRYPSYFPYWLQINGAVGKAKIRIIDSGSNIRSPKPLFRPLAF